MTSPLTVRVYGVRFGDAILITVPDLDRDGEEVERRILIDVGNVGIGEGGADFMFSEVLEDVRGQLDGRNLDLYVLTHEHLDHAQGLLYAEEHGIEIRADHAWLPASTEDGYYTKHEDARKKQLAMRRSYDLIKKHFAAKENPAWLEAMLLNNDYRSTAKCIEHIKRNVANDVAYIHRDYDIGPHNPFQETRFDIWAPEENTAVYYKGLRSVADPHDRTQEGAGLQQPSDLLPPSGVDADAFYNLVNIRKNGYLSNLLMIDQAGNDSSIVFSMEWRGRTLLFTGDAGQLSWEMMNRPDIGKIREVDFLKVSHHGSVTGIPSIEILDALLSPGAVNQKKEAVVSTYPGTYGGIPAESLLKERVESRCKLSYVDKGKVADGKFIDIEFPPLHTP